MQVPNLRLPNLADNTMPTIAIPNLPMLERPQPDAEQVNECLWGEQVQLLGAPLNGYQHCKRLNDAYPGYVDVAGLRSDDKPRDGATTMLVTARSTLLFSEPDIKSRIVWRLPLLAKVVIDAAAAETLDDGEAKRFACTSQGHFALRSHLRACSPRTTGTATSALELAESLFIGAPYRWGGRTPDGADCSGLLQSVCTLAGIELPRDSGPQEQAMTTCVEFAARQCGDLVFWPGHVGILREPTVLLHANAHSMDCRFEPLAAVIARAGEPSSIGRLPLS